MELFKIYQINADYKDGKAPPDWQMRHCAKIVFMDKSQLDKAPLIYQLKDSYLSIENTLNFCKMSPTMFSKEGFLFLGQQSSFDRKKKQILLDNGNTISYNHLVIVSGKRPFALFEHEELISALQALNDALKVKPKIPSSFASAIKNTDNKAKQNPQGSTQASKQPLEDLSIDKMIQPNFFASIPQAIPIELHAINNRLYEVQL